MPTICLQISELSFLMKIVAGNSSLSVLRYASLGIPVKVNIDSGGKPNGVPERR